MIKCYLSRHMGDRKVKIAELARELDVNRSTISALYHETAQLVDLKVMEKLCEYFGCGVGDLFEYRKD